MARMPPSVRKMRVSFLLIAGREAAEEPLTMQSYLGQGIALQSLAMIDYASFRITI